MPSASNATAFAAIWDEAHAAGHAAATAHTPRPMTVIGGGKTYFVPEGLCGFAWVTIRPATHPFAKWTRKHKGSHKAYYGGEEIWVSGYEQSFERKQAYANAFAAVLNRHGITAYPGSRLD